MSKRNIAWRWTRHLLILVMSVGSRFWAKIKSMIAWSLSLGSLIVGNDM